MNYQAKTNTEIVKQRLASNKNFGVTRSIKTLSVFKNTLIVVISKTVTAST